MGLSAKEYVFHSLKVLMVILIIWFCIVGKEKHAILKKEYPQCFQHHKDTFWIILVGSMVVIGITKELITRLFFNLIERNLSKKQLEELKGNQMDKYEFVNKLSNHVFKALYYTVISLVFIYLLQDLGLLHWFFGGELDTFERVRLFQNYPCPQVPDLLVDLYLFKLGYYLYESGYSCLFHRHRHDFTENLTHHICTIGLILASYTFNWFDFGALIFFLTGVTDIFVSLMRITYFWESFALKITSFIFMLGSFIIFRDIYQVYIMWELYQTVFNGDKKFEVIREVCTLIDGLLVVLLILNYFWTYLMVKGLWQRLTGKKEEAAKKHL